MIVLEKDAVSTAGNFSPRTYLGTEQVPGDRAVGFSWRLRYCAGPDRAVGTDSLPGRHLGLRAAY